MVRAVLFDLDDTLFDHQHCAAAALAGVRSMHSCFERVDVTALEEAHARILETLHRDVMLGRVPLDAARVERFRRLYEYAGVQADLELARRTAMSYKNAYIAARRAISGAAELLSALKPHAKIGIVSNNLLEEQREKLRHCGLDGLFDALVVSEEAGVAKPDPRIFEMALARLGCEAPAAVMVGDSWAADIEGAMAAGIRAIWFNRSGVDMPAGAAGVEMVTSLEPTAEIARRILGVKPERGRVPAP